METELPATISTADIRKLSHQFGQSMTAFWHVQSDQSRAKVCGGRQMSGSYDSRGRE